MCVADLPTLSRTPNFLKIPYYKPILRYVPLFNFDGFFWDKKFGFLKMNLQKFSSFAKKKKDILSSRATFPR